MSFIYKPSTYKGPVFLASGGRSEAPTITLPNGQKVTGQYHNTIDEGGGPVTQYVFDQSVLGQQGATLSYGGQQQVLDNSNMSYRGDNIGSLQPSSKGAIGGGFSGGGGGGFTGGGMGGFGGAPSQFAPGQIGQFGFFPGYLGNMFPSPSLIDYQSIKPADYKFTDPLEYAKKFGEFNRTETSKNFGQAQQYALDTLNTELKGLENFAPATAALKREQTSVDNIFNQQQRSNQIKQALPGVEGQLNAQATRAETYASGRIPDEVTDRGYELGIRSGAADNATFGGFGARSSVARKASDLMSAEGRVKLSQYGDQLLSSNINQKSSLLLAPTEYSNAGSEIRVMPEVGAGRLTSQNLSELNQNTLINPATALSSEINQNQFDTQLKQRTNEFNATNDLGAQQFNAGNENQFKMSEFQYNVGYAGTVAGAAQTNANTNLALAQQQQYQSIFQDQMGAAQQAQQAGAIAQGVGTLVGAVGGVGSIISGLGSLFGYGNQTGAQGAQTAPAQPGATDSFGNQTPASGPVQSTGVNSDLNFGSAAPSGPVMIPSGSTVPDGYTGVQSDASGGTVAIPDAQASAPISSFAESLNLGPILGRSLSSNSNQDVTKALLTTSSAVLSGAGIHSTPQPGTQNIGVNNMGAPVYANKMLLSSPNTNLGSDRVSAFQQVLDPTGVFSAQDSSNLSKIGALSGDAAFLASLTDARQRGDTKGFVGTMLNRLEQPAVNSLSNDPQNRAGLSSAFTAYQLYQNWDRMSPGQKALGVANLGIQGFKFATGENLATKNIIAPSENMPGLNVGQAMGLFSAGYNVYSLTKNWDQMNAIQKIAGGTATAASIANVGRQFGLLGSGTTGAAVPGISSQVLAQAGLKAAPQYGVGAVTGAAGTEIPAGYSLVSNTGGEIVAAPTANAASATGATAGSLLGTAAGVAGVALGAQAVYKNWGTGGKAGAIQGALGGAAMSAGLYALGATNPFLLGGIVAVSLLGGMAKTGKSEPQMGRDAARAMFQRSGGTDKDFNITLADGTKANIGVDGHGSRHSISDPSLLSPDQKGKVTDLSPFDVDYTNDLDYSASMAGISLSRLLAGGKATNIDQVGSQVANGLLGNVGFNKEMSEGNFSKTMANARAVYAQSGIKSKSDAYQLANQAYAEGRIDDSDHVAMLQSFNMMYDQDGFGTAQKLLSGRHKGIEVAASQPSKPTVSIGDVKVPSSVTKAPAPIEGQEQQNVPIEASENKSTPNLTIFQGNKNITNMPSVSSIYSKDEIRSRNRRKYQSQVPQEVAA